MSKKMNLKVIKITNAESLDRAESEHRIEGTYDFIVFSNNTSYKEIAEVVVPDKDGPYAHPLYLLISKHNALIGINSLGTKVIEFFHNENMINPVDVLSVTANMSGSKIVLKTLIRPYKNIVNFASFFELTGDNVYDEYVETEPEPSGKLIIPEKIKNFRYSEDDINIHREKLAEQNKILKNSTIDKPFLNQIDKYVPSSLPDPYKDAELVYDLKTKDMQIKTIAAYEDFTRIFNELMIFVSGVEYYRYANVIKGEERADVFMDYLKQYIRTTYINKGFLDKEDLPAMMDKLDNALFKFYILQDLIDDPDVTDIKITGYDSIRARIKGKAYVTNICFVDANDYLRFLQGIAIKNRIKPNIPAQTFTDSSDDRYILRFSLIAPFVNSSGLPDLHIRKISKKKLLSKELLEVGMFDEKVRQYLLDCAKTSSGVVFAGPPGSGKTVCLNWFIEEGYEQSAEVLVIQENDELFSYKKGIMFQHVVNYTTETETAVSLEELGKLALVAGANVFVIGEAKGAEICSAITLSNSGCRTAITIHSDSSVDTINKMADLALRGYAKDIEQAKRMLKSFKTIVYLEDFKVKEISEAMYYDDEKKDIVYRPIYRREN